jgi:3,4-dihydroxy 2-butanone 4-phosphate synthase/GTP cyclohydrolase II
MSKSAVPTALKRIVVSRLPTRHGSFDIYGYEASGREHVALVCGTLPLAEPVLVRIHSECLTGEAFGSLRCDCRDQLDLALDAIAARGSGVLVYLRGHEGRAIGLINKLRAYALQDRGRDTVRANSELGLPTDARDYGDAIAILEDLGVHELRLMTNNPAKVRAVTAAGLHVVERVPIVVAATTDNADYLRAKKSQLGHIY